jgi:hypothetical protein
MPGLWLSFAAACGLTAVLLVKRTADVAPQRAAV